MKPEYLYSIATDLGLQFDGEARVRLLVGH